MQKSDFGVIQGFGTRICGHFQVGDDVVMCAFKIPSVPDGCKFFAPDEANIEFDNIAELKNELKKDFKIEPGSVIGPKELNLLLKHEKSGAKAKIIAVFDPKLPSALSIDGGIVTFLSQSPRQYRTG
ncbi:hypothetical protein GQ42DRAFT_165606 [Ramicandelaber brevisporus]|nr:hypothetical protein GQ42DRAFT_165606 [Ramicandelaber brevisporus]